MPRPWVNAATYCVVACHPCASPQTQTQNPKQNKKKKNKTKQNKTKKKKKKKGAFFGERRAPDLGHGDGAGAWRADGSGAPCGGTLRLYRDTLSRAGHAARRWHSSWAPDGAVCVQNDDRGGAANMQAPSATAMTPPLMSLFRFSFLFRRRCAGRWQDGAMRAAVPDGPDPRVGRRPRRRSRVRGH